MRKLWLLFSQVVTIVLACWFVVATLQPDWLRAIGLHLSRQPGSAAASAAALLTSSPSETLRNAAKVAAPAVVSVITNPEQAEQLVQQRHAAHRLATRAVELVLQFRILEILEVQRRGVLQRRG